MKRIALTFILALLSFVALDINAMENDSIEKIDSLKIQIDTVGFINVPLGVTSTEIDSLKIQIDTVKSNDSIYLELNMCYINNDTVLFSEKIYIEPIQTKVTDPISTENKDDINKLLLIIVIIESVLLLFVIGYIVFLLIKTKNKVKVVSGNNDGGKKIGDGNTVAKSVYDELDEKYNKLVEEKEKLDDEIKKLKKNKKQDTNVNEIKNLQEKYDDLNNKKKSLENDIYELKENQKKEIEDAIKKTEEKAQREYDVLNKKKELLDNEISELKENQKKEIEDAVNKVEEKAQRKYDELNNKKESLENDINELKKNQKKEIDKAVNIAEEKAQEKYDKLESDKNAEINKLEDSQKMFTTHLTLIPFAQEYAKGISKLNDVANEILSNAAKLTELKLEDYYHVNKAISKYAIKVSKIDMKQFATDVNMAAKSQFAFNDCTLSTFNQKDSDSTLKVSTKQYFFEKYLKAYIDAIMVLNESLSGVYHFMDDLPKDKCVIFDTTRKKIIDACNAIDIDVFSVKLFDMIGEKIDLKVEKVDTPFGKTGQIIEICNCQVKLKGANMPDDKIFVKVQS